MLLPLLALGWTLAANPTPAERSYTPCPDSSPEWAEARKRFEALDAKLTELPDDGNTRDTLAALEALLTSRCFEMSREEGNRPREELPALALKAWWKAGGREWVESYLELGKPGVRKVVLPPEARKVLALDTVPASHRLAALLCPAAEVSCAPETEAWYARADAAFLPENQRRASVRDPDSEPDPLQKCEQRARKKPKRWRYTAWRQCVDQGDLGGQVLPIARLRTPKDGWLVLRGRRGHYSFSDEVRAYHLATGTAYISQSCSGLALTESGRVDGARTDAARQTQVHAGTLKAEKLRELTWMLLLGTEVHSVLRPRVKVLTVPADFRVEWRERDEGTVEGSMGGSMWFTTAQTRLQWAWFPPEKAEPITGKLTWPNSSHPQEDHADVLIVEAEATFTEGCPSLPPPLDTLDFSSAPSVSGLDAPGGVTRTQDALVEALRTWRPPPACASGKPGAPGTP